MSKGITLRALSVLLMFLVAGCYLPFMKVNPHKDARVRAELLRGEPWLFKSGLSQFYVDGDKAHLDRQLQITTGGFNNSSVYVDSGAKIFRASSALAHRGIVWTCFAREPGPTGIYEYWVVGQGSSGSDVFRETRFLITYADSLESSREVVFESETFFETYTAPEGTIVRFPVENDFAVAAIHPWYDPESFEDTSLYGLMLKWKGLGENPVATRVYDYKVYEIERRKQDKRKKRAIWLKEDADGDGES